MATPESNLYKFSLGRAKAPPPVRWMLSNEAAKAIQEDIRDEGLSTKTAKTQNAETVQRIVASLHVPESAAAH
ncbi:MAG TPA: hypothetical protein VEP30_07330 [Chthoniobacterales bacterium]|nr:hypothetical protein [Chthoniobacterales bacterium]